MTENEIKLINFIRNHDNPEQALIIAIEVISAYLKQPQSSPEPSPVAPQE